MISFTAHRDSSNGIASFLLEQHWHELEGLEYLDPTGVELSFDYLSSYSPDELPLGVVHTSDGSFLVEDSLLQFYFDLMWAWPGSRAGYADILVKELDDEVRTDSTSFHIFNAMDDASSAVRFLEFLEFNTVIGYGGTFRSRGGRRIPGVQTNKAEDMRTLNAVCVDIDSADLDAPLLPEDFEKAYRRIPSELVPSYISLSGTGVHLWYVFEPVQTFTVRHPRRQKFKSLIEGVYDYYAGLFEDLPVRIDKACSSINHGFRLPGTLTKYGDLVRCFRPEGSAFMPTRFTLASLAAALGKNCGGEAPALSEDDVSWKDELTLEREADERRLARMGASQATRRQMGYIADLYREGAVSEEDMEAAGTASVAQASRIIERSLSNRRSAHAVPSPTYPGQKRAHTVKTGPEGGVYGTLLRAMTQKDEQGRWRVRPGRREVCLYMLAGVAYMMSDPILPRETLKADLRGLLESEWGTTLVPPLTSRDIEKALTGYKKDNWRTRASIVETLGFDPFGEPAKRNGRSREEHLAFCRAKKSLKQREENLAAVAAYLAENPGSSQRAAARELGLSYPTVNKYWAEACGLAGVEDVRSRKAT